MHQTQQKGLPNLPGAFFMRSLNFELEEVPSRIISFGCHFYVLISLLDCYEVANPEEDLSPR